MISHGASEMLSHQKTIFHFFRHALALFLMLFFTMSLNAGIIWSAAGQPGSQADGQASRQTRLFLGGYLAGGLARRTDRRTDRWTDRKTERRTERQKDIPHRHNRHCSNVRPTSNNETSLRLSCFCCCCCCWRLRPTSCSVMLRFHVIPTITRHFQRVSRMCACRTGAHTPLLALVLINHNFIRRRVIAES